MNECVEQATDVELKDELRARGYFVMEHVLDDVGMKTVIDMIEQKGYVVLEEGLPEGVVWWKYHSYLGPDVDKGALDRWEAAQGIAT